MTDERPIVVAYDGSEDARHALEAAAALFARHLAYAVHVWRPMPRPGGALLGVSKAVAHRGVERLDAKTATESERLAEEAAGIAEAHGLDAEPLSVRAEGAPWAAIVETAEEHDAAAVVVGSRGLSLVSSALLGSVSEGVLRHAERPVLVVPRGVEHAPRGSRSAATNERDPARADAPCAQPARR